MHIAPHAEGWPCLLKKKRADPMLSDPNLPRLPLPTATSLCSLSLLYSNDHFSSGVGIYTCGSPQTSPKQPFVMTWMSPPELSEVMSFRYFCGMPCKGGIWAWADTDLLKSWHTNVHFFFSTMPPFLTWKLGFLPSKSSNPLGEGLGRVLEIWLTEDSLQSRMKYFTLLDVVEGLRKHVR